MNAMAGKIEMARVDRAYYGSLSLVRGRWIMSGIEPHVALRLKAIFPKIEKSKTQVFEFSNTDESCTDLEWFCHRFPLSVSDADRKLLIRGSRAFTRRRDEIEQILLPDWQPPKRSGFKPGKALYHYQEQAVEMAHRTGRLLCLDDVGLGKSVTALGAIVAGADYLPAAIICQTHMPTQWQDEFIKPFTYLTSHIVKKATPYKLPPANVYLLSYSKLAGWADVANSGLFKTVIFDEIQDIRQGEKTDKGKAARAFCNNAKLLIAATATPIYNYGDEIFRIVDYIAQGALGTWDEFKREWCSYQKGEHWLVKDTKALGSYLREQQLVVRRLRQGRKINRHIFEVSIDHTSVKESDDLAVMLATKVIEGDFYESGLAARSLNAYLRQQTGIAKAKAVAASAKMLLRAGTPVIIAGWHRAVYDIWMKELGEFNPMLYTGSESINQKNRTKRAFIEGGTDCMIISLRSGVGLDGLQTRCNTVIFGEFDWSRQVEEQVLGRVDRPGQKEDEITALYPWVNFGSDPVVMEIQGLKSSQSTGIVDPFEDVQASEADPTRLKLLAQRYLKSVGRG